MAGNLLIAWGTYAFFVPFFVIVLILIHYAMVRARWRSKKRRGLSGLGFYPSAFALGIAFQFMQIFHRPSVAFAMEAKLDEDADDDGNGDPDSPQSRLKQFHRQLLRIRRGESIDRLQWRL